MRAEDAPRSGGLEDLGGAVEAGAEVVAVERRQPVVDDGLAVAADPDLAGVAIAQQRTRRQPLTGLIAGSTISGNAASTSGEVW